MNFLRLLLIALFLIPFELNASELKPNQSIVVSAHPLATKAGEDILQMGGNAFDAAVAVSAALNVVEPAGSGLAGGGFWLIYDAKNDRYKFYDAREIAPHNAHRDMYLDDKGEIIEGASTHGPLAAGIPSAPKIFETVTNNYGALGLKQNLTPAIILAKQGFPVDNRYISGVTYKRAKMLDYPETAKIFLDNNEIPKEGWILKQTDLAKTLSIIADQGAKGFYEGVFAQNLIKDVQKHGGIWTLEDLKNYNVIERAPYVATYKDVKYIMPDLPSSGGRVIGNILAMLERYDLDTMNKVERVHILTEIMRRAYYERSVHMGDPDFNERNLSFLTSPNYIDKQLLNLSMERATNSYDIGASKHEGAQTTHFAVMDKEGNRVAVTQSLNLWFGSNYVPKGTGMILNNQMDDFSIKAGVKNAYGLVGGKINEIEPNKRMLSSMTPTFVESKKGLAIIGTPGGSRIISMVLLASLDWMNGMDALNIVSKPRFHHQYIPDEITYEEGAFSDEVAQSLMSKGHNLNKVTQPYGNMQIITWDYESGAIKKASDPRGGAEAFVY